MFLKVFVVCAFVSLSQAVFHRHHTHLHGNHGHGMNHGSQYPKHKTVIMNPAPRRQKYNEDEMDAYLAQQRSKFFELGKTINAKASNICRWNYATLTDAQKRSCSCIAVFGFLNDGEGDPYSTGYSIYMRIWEAFSQPGGPNAACSSRNPNSPRELHDLCHCMTGQSLV